MRTANFRDHLLWNIAYRLGIDPQRNLDDDQASAITNYINGYSRRTFDATDYPEWTFTLPFFVARIGPTAHIVPYSIIPWHVPPLTEDDRVLIGRVFKVYLRDPQQTPFRPLDTPYTLRPEGIHVGFEHGDLVWIKFIVQAPEFTSEPWENSRTYAKGELTYSPVTGQCYKSKLPDNRGHDPKETGVGTLPTEIVQEHQPPSSGLLARNKVIELGLTDTNPGPDPPTPPAAGSKWVARIGDSIYSGAIVTEVTHTATGSEPLTAIATDLAVQLAAAFPAFVSITVDLTNPAKPFIRIEDDSDFSAMGYWTNAAPGDSLTITSELNIKQAQPYDSAIDPAPRTRQITNVTLPLSMVMGDNIYSITFRSPDGLEHYVEYQGLHTDGAVQILNGLAQQIEGSADPYLEQVLPTVDAYNSVLVLSSQDEVSVQAVFAPGSNNIYWALVEFPFELINQVERGGYADSLKEEGQTDKGMAEEQIVPSEQAVSVASNTKTGDDILTDQLVRKGGPQK